MGGAKTIFFTLSSIVPSLVLIPQTVFSATPDQVDIPIEFGPAYIRDQALHQVFTGADSTARVWDDGSGCNFLVLSEPAVEITTDAVRFTMPAEGRTGQPYGENCLLLIEWQGVIEVDERPRIDDNGNVITFEVVDSRLRDERGNRLLSGAIWDWTKHHVHPRLQAIAFDLQPALDELRQFLPLFLPHIDTDKLTQLIGSVRLTGVGNTGRGISAQLSFDVPRSPQTGLSTREQPEPVLTDEELEGLNRSLRQYDAFLTFAVKHAALSTDSASHRDRLLEILLDTRHTLLDAAASTHPVRSDPVRVLFIDTWKRLAPIMRTISHDLPGGKALNLLSFIAAADALEGLDALGPSVDLEVSTDALRRMARLMSPDSETDPLMYDEQVDPTIRNLFEFGAPPNVPTPLAPVPRSGGLIPDAFAEAISPKGREQLNRWLPKRGELSSYLLRVRLLLEDTADEVLDSESLPAQFHEVYRPLVLATAWQESCWRQFVVKQGKRWPIESSAGAVGMMQVMPRVWRGFYDTHSLSWDMAYNVEAGSEILHRYLVRYAIAKGEHRVAGRLHDLARATYAIYNGGPRRMTRYRSDGVAKRAKAVDQSFWNKYQLIRNGKHAAVADCYG